MVVCQFLDLDRSLAVPVVEALLKAWPEGFESNSPKVRRSSTHTCPGGEGGR